MPAVTVENPLVLPKVETPDPTTTTPRKVRQVATAPQGLEGEGFPVRRAFAGINTRHLDPFIMMDQMGEVEYAPGEPKGTPWHPHRGFETVTYLIDGKFVHRDSTGGGGFLGGGDTQWMTAGAGLLHIETPPEDLVVSGGLFHGLQLWVNLPSSDKMTPPRYQDISGDKVKLLTTPDGGAILRLIAGGLGDQQGPGNTHTPITMIHATISPGARITLPWRPDFNALVYALNGAGTVGEENRPFTMGQAVLFGDGDSITVQANGTQESRSPNLDVVILGGRPIGEPVAWYGPFVMNSHQELEQAFNDFRAGLLGTVPKD